MLKGRKKLGIFGALPPYLGGKRRLCPLIFREIDRVIPRRHWRGLTFLDAFLGGGSVSLFAKAQGFAVIAADIAERSMVIGRALIENTRVRLAREDVLRVLAAAKDRKEPDRIEATLAPSTFTAEQARFLDAALEMAARTLDSAKANLIRLLALRVALLCHAYAQVRKGTIHRVSTGEYESITESAVYHYIDGLRLTTPARLWELAQQINAGIFEGRATVMKASILDAASDIEADVMYADPPYPGVMSYEREYKVIDEILEGASRKTSPFTAKDGHQMIDVLFERATHIPIWVLSLGNAVVGVSELEAKMAKHGRKVSSIALRYQHLPAVATDEKKATNQEFIVVGVDEALLQREMGRRDGRSEVVPEPVVEDHVGAAGAEGSSPSGLSSDPTQHRESNMAEQLSAAGGADVLAVGDCRLDPPGAAFLECALGGDCELGLAHDASGSPESSAPVKEDSR